MDEKDEYYSDFDRIEIRSDSNLAYIWVVEFRN